MKVLASQKQLENKYKASQTTADDWYRRAKLALEKGDEVLAREALKRRKDYEVLWFSLFLNLFLTMTVRTSYKGKSFVKAQKLLMRNFALM